VDRIGFSGYWGGTNSLGITEITERFSIPGNEQLAGISLGIGKIKSSGTNSEQDSEITLKVYNGSSVPEKLIYSQPVKIKNLTTNAMNYIGFTEIIEPSDTFFIGFELSNLSLNDTLVVYQSLRPAHKENFFFFKQNRSWKNFKTANTENYAMANVFELVACNVELLFNDTMLVKNPMEALIYPNPAQGIFTFEAGQTIDPENIHVFNLLGQVVDAKLMNSRNKKIQIDLSGNQPGVYFVRFETATGFVSKKISWIGR
jgi:lysyl endopeptidase